MPRTKLDYETADKIRELYKSRQSTQAEIARKFGISQSVVSKIYSDQIWWRPQNGKRRRATTANNRQQNF